MVIVSPDEAFIESYYRALPASESIKLIENPQQLAENFQIQPIQGGTFVIFRSNILSINEKQAILVFALRSSCRVIFVTPLLQHDDLEFMITKGTYNNTPFFYFVIQIRNPICL